MSATATLIALKEVTESWRDGRLRVLMGVVALLLLLSGLAGVYEVQSLRAAEGSAAQLDRATFLAQGARNPHTVAHFGQFAFAPTTVLALLDPGVRAYSGAALWLEAHYQNPLEHRPVEDALEIARFATLSPSLLLQLVVPLLIGVLGFASVSGERERGSLRLMLSQGASIGEVFAGKLAGLALLTLLIVAPPLLIVLAALVVASPDVLDLDVAVRLLLWFAANATYLLFFAAITLAISARAPTSRAAFIGILACWTVVALAVPRVSAAVSSLTRPLPEASQFWSGISESLHAGVDGHSPDERRAALERAALQQYGVERLEDLPISFAGLALEAGEAHGNKVYDAAFDSLWSQHEAQDRLRTYFAIFSPTLAIGTLSMALAGTDAHEQRSFARAAEQHRRHVVALLNDDMKRHARGRDFDYVAPPELWSTIPTLSYRSPGVIEALQRTWPLLSLLLFATALSLALGWLGMTRLARV